MPGAGGCAPAPVDRFKELVVVEPSVVENARARNDANGPWSFRHVMEGLTPVGRTPADFVLEWLKSFERPTQVNLFGVPSRVGVRGALICPWLRATPANECDEGCASCRAETLDLARAPFRLMGFSNRIDLHRTEDPDNVGESRFVFAATRGPGDDPASAPLRMSVAVEYRNPTTEGRDVYYWANRWHALGTHRAYDEAFLVELEALYADVTALPTSLNQVRTNEIEFDWIWDMREFKLRGDSLRLSSTSRTPDKSLNGSADLARFVLANRNAIVSGRHQVSELLQGGFARSDDTSWSLPGVDDVLRRSFARQTCDGCHRSETRPLDENFHFSPLRVGRERLSTFLHDPAAPANDELAFREQIVQSLLCETEANGGYQR